MSLKVVHVLYSGLGGHGSVFFSLVRADSNRTVNSSAIFCGIEDVNPDYVALCQQYQVPYVSIRKKPGLDMGTYRKLYRALKKIKPDIVVLHGSAFIPVAALYRLFRKKMPVIVRETQAHHLKTPREWYWLKLSVKLANRLIFLTPESLDGVDNRFPKLRVREKAEIIPNGIDTDLYTPQNRNPSRPGLTIGMQSRLQKIKDHPTLLRAFHSILKSAPDLELKLRIAGDGTTMNELQELTAQLGITDRVEFCGMLAEAELKRFMDSLDIYVHATLGETMSNSIMQAMACGLPIIASDVWGVNNMLNDNVNAILVPPGSPDAMAEALLKLVRDQQLATSLGNEARKTAELEYSNHRLFRQYAGLYAELVK